MSKGAGARARKRPALDSAPPQGENGAQQTVYVRLAGQRRFYRRAVTVEEVGGARCLVVRKEATGKLKYTARLDGAAALAQAARLKLIIQPATGADLELRFSSRSALEVWCNLIAGRPTGANGPEDPAAGSSSSPAVPQAGSGVRVHFVDEPASERATLADAAEENPRKEKRAANGVFLDQGLWQESAYAAETTPVDYLRPRRSGTSRLAIARRGSPRASSSRMSVDEPTSPEPSAQAASQASKAVATPARSPSSRCCMSCSSSAESVDEGAIGAKPRARAAAAVVVAAGPIVAARADAEAVAVAESELPEEDGAESAAPLVPFSEALTVAEDEAANDTVPAEPSSLLCTPRGTSAEDLAEAESSALGDEAALAAGPEEAAAADAAADAAFLAAAPAGPPSLPCTPRGNSAEELAEAESSALCDEASMAAEADEETAAADAAADAAFLAAAPATPSLPGTPRGKSAEDLAEAETSASCDEAALAAEAEGETAAAEAAAEAAFLAAARPPSLPCTPRGKSAEHLAEAESSALCDEAALAAEAEEETAAADAAAEAAAFLAAAELAAAAEAARLVAAGAAASARLAAAAAEAERYTAAAAARAADDAAAGADRLAAIESAALSAAPTAESAGTAESIPPPPRLSPASSTSSVGSLEPSDEAGWTAEALTAAVAASARDGGLPMATLGEVPPGVRLLLSPSLLGALSEALPRALRLRPWRLAFSTESDGCSLQTLLRRLEGRAESVLLVRDAEGALFGVFLSEAWRAGPRYFGTGESFLFSARRPGQAEPRLVAHRWTRANACFAHADHMGIAFGGPACGLALDKSLEAGSSKRSETYGNAPLAGSADFVCLKLEVWSLER